jgi:hypothetical protein
VRVLRGRSIHLWATRGSLATSPSLKRRPRTYLWAFPTALCHVSTHESLPVLRHSPEDSLGAVVRVSPLQAIATCVYDPPDGGVGHLLAPATAGGRFSVRLHLGGFHIHTSREGWSEAMAAKWLFLVPALRRGSVSEAA